MTQQLPLALTLRHAPHLEDFVVGRNEAVIDALQRALDGSGERVVFLTGPPDSGRSHLLMGQCSAAQARGLQSAYVPLAQHPDLAPAMLDGLEGLDLIAIDDVQCAAARLPWEQALFALFNRCLDRDTRLLFSGDRGPAALPLRLPDLRSRLASGLTLALKPLDDRGRLALLQCLAARHALTLPEEVARYVLTRSSRDPGDLITIIQRLDRASLAEQRRLTIPFVRDLLHQG